METKAPASVAGPPADLVETAAELKSRFPATIGGEPFPVETRIGDELAGMGVEAFVEPLGVGLDHVVVAVGGSPAIGDESTTVTAYRVVGAPTERLIERVVELTWLETPDPTEESVVAGKTVRTPGRGSYIYGSGDTVYVIQGDEALSIELLEALP